MSNSVFKLIIFLSFISLNLADISAQSIKNVIINDSLSVDTTIYNIQLPSLQTFIEAGLNNSPLLKIDDNEIEQNIQKLKIIKSAWSDNIFIEGLTKFGLFNQLIISGEAGTSNEVGVQSANQQFNYYTGLSMKIPLSEFLNRKKSIKIINRDLDNSKLKRQQLVNDFKLLIIDQYYKVVNLKEVFSFLIEDIQSKEISFLKAEKDLECGTVSIVDFSNIVTERRKSRESYYKTKNELLSEYYKLQIITGLNF